MIYGLGFFWGENKGTFIAQELDRQVYNDIVYAVRIKLLKFFLSLLCFLCACVQSFLAVYSVILIPFFFLYYFILKKTNLVMILEVQNLQSFKCI